MNPSSPQLPPLLSILTPAVPSRIYSLGSLTRELETQIGSARVEHLVLLDNKRRTVGEKRDALLRAARGQFVAYVDDDDWISQDYVSEILQAINSCPQCDVVTFRQSVTYNGVTGVVEFKLGHPNEAFVPDGLTKRNAWHICAWRRTLAVQSGFPASNYGEDWAFAAPLCAAPDLKEVHVPKILHFYQHSAATTEAPPPV
jgi:glycosyltransferase involved in cell wall biosynthesis